MVRAVAFAHAEFDILDSLPGLPAGFLQRHADTVVLTGASTVETGCGKQHKIGWTHNGFAFHRRGYDAGLPSVTLAIEPDHFRTRQQKTNELAAQQHVVGSPGPGA